MKKIRYAVVGLGHIAQIAVLPAFRRSPHSELAALVSGDAEKLKTLGRKYGVSRLYDYEEYDLCLRSGEIDAVFIALPNDQHEEFAIKAARAGIHVLCEKPLAVTRTASAHIIRAARANHIRLMTAYRLHFDPENLKSIQIANSGQIGDARYFTSEFGYQLKEGNIRSRREEGGSPLHDLGVYCINAARYLFKAEPTEVFAVGASPDPHPSHIIQTIAATMRFPRGRIASFTCSFGTASIGNFRIVGTRGDLFVENAYEYQGELTHHLTVGEKKRTWKSKPGDQFAAEIEYFSGCVLSKKEPEPSGAHGLADVAIIEALLRSVRTGRPVSLRGTLPRIARRPTLALAIRKPAHRKPKLLKVAEAAR